MNPTFRKCLAVFLVALMAMSCFAGCKKVKSGRIRQRDSKLYKFVVERKADEVTKDSLGDIVTEGDYYEADPNNMLCYTGAYKGPDYVTLIFDGNSPIDLENIELYISEDSLLNRNLDGILYQEKDSSKYITFKYETKFLEYPDGTTEQFDSARSETSFTIPTKADEPMSYYIIRITPVPNSDYEAFVGEFVQKEVIEQSYWTDYKYDKVIQYYDRETGSWTEESTKDLYTDNMPLE